MGSPWAFTAGAKDKESHVPRFIATLGFVMRHAAALATLGVALLTTAATGGGDFPRF